MDAALTFGASSSPGIFDKISELILRMALHAAGLERATALRQLDDNVLIGTEGEVKLGYNTYNQVALDLGVLVAPEEEDKAFGPQQFGAVLGFQFSSKDWVWTMEKKKGEKILRLLFKIWEDRSITQGELQSLIGKITFYFPLFEGKFERTFFLAAQNQKVPKASAVTVTPGNCNCS